jgi:CIC family chloride channel protein
LVSLIRAMSCFSPPVVSLPAPGGTARLHNLVQLELKPIQTLLQNYPYTQFPVVINGQIPGVLTREEATRAIREKRPPALAEATICPPDLSLREVETQLIESKTGLLLLQEKPDGTLVGILTLHDILRAQQAAAEEGFA